MVLNAELMLAFYADSYDDNVVPRDAGSAASAFNDCHSFESVFEKYRALRRVRGLGSQKKTKDTTHIDTKWRRIQIFNLVEI
jgi:hypothetical protein